MVHWVTMYTSIFLHVFTDETMLNFTQYEADVLMLIFQKFHVLCMNVLSACRSVQQVHAYCPEGPEEDTRCSGSGVTDGCDLFSGC